MKHVRAPLLLVVSVLTLGAAAAWRPAAPPETGEGVIPALAQTTPGWYKGNLHTHSLWSDGDDFPEMITDWYRRHGYHFLGLSDHNILSEGQRWIDVPTKGSRVEALAKYRARFGERWVEERTAKTKTGTKRQVRLKPLAEFRNLLETPGRFLLVPAEEITYRFAKSPVHVNAFNLRDAIAPADGDSVAETVRANLRSVAEQRKKSGWRMVASLNHPNYGWGIRAEDMLAEELHLFEVFNGHPGVRNYGDATHPSSERLWDIALALRLGKLRLPVLYGLATDDAHNYHAMGAKSANPGRGWIMVRAPYLTAEAIIAALEKGDFYATSGVRLRDVRRKGDLLTVAVDPEAGVTYKTEFIATFKDAPLDSEPRRDKKGKILDVTRVYSPEVGKVVATVKGPEATYRLTGRELYVRARVTSTKAHPNPFLKGDVEVAWTQPVVP